MTIREKIRTWLGIDVLEARQRQDRRDVTSIMEKQLDADGNQKLPRGKKTIRTEARYEADMKRKGMHPKS